LEKVQGGSYYQLNLQEASENSSSHLEQSRVLGLGGKSRLELRVPFIVSKKEEKS
jgi:hypothetical protein